MIYDMPTIKELWIFTLDDPAPTPRWYRKHEFWTRQDISFDIWHAYLIIALLCIFCTWWPRPTRIPQKWQLRPTLQDLSYDIRHAYLLRTLDFYTWWLRPTPSMGSKTLFFLILERTRQDLSFNIRHACLWIFVFDEPTPPRGPKNMKIETYSSIPFIWYATCLPSKNFGFLYLMTPPHSLEWVLQHEFWNVLVETFHLIYDMPTLT